MTTIILVIVILLEAVIIYVLIANDRFRTMCREILDAIKKAMKRKPKEEAK
jgi:hypothetical protein